MYIREVWVVSGCPNGSKGVMVDRKEYLAKIKAVLVVLRGLGAG